jgi:hypothetical protein
MMILVRGRIWAVPDDVKCHFVSSIGFWLESEPDKISASMARETYCEFPGTVLPKGHSRKQDILNGTDKPGPGAVHKLIMVA